MLYTANLTKLAKYTVDLYKTLERETGQATGYKQNGSLSIATNEERWDELRRGASMARAFGVPAEPVTAKRVQELWPLMNTADLIGAIHFPEDGSTNPADTTMAFAKGARAGGARIVEDCKVTGVRTKNGRALGVTTEAGRRQRRDRRELRRPLGPRGRQDGRRRRAAPRLRALLHRHRIHERAVDPAGHARHGRLRLLQGGRRQAPASAPSSRRPSPGPSTASPRTSASPSCRRISTISSRCCRAPSIACPGSPTPASASSSTAPRASPPTSAICSGESLELENFYVAAGFNSVGIQSAGGVGMALAHWIAEGHPPFDLWDVDSRRSMPHQNNKTFLIDRVSEALGLLYAMHWPYRQFETARGVRKTPLYQRLKAHNACFGEVAGWERANWFAPAGVEPKYQYSFKRQNWFDYCAQECRATRTAVGLFDQSTFAKFTVRGPDAETVLQRICANDVGGAPGRAVYTQWLNERGGIEADLTVTRLAEDAYMVVTAAATARRDLLWLKKHIPSDARAAVEDITSAYAVLGVMGPNSRALLQKLTATDLSNAAFPFGASREIEMGYASLRASRISYMGELGWELYVPAEFAVGVFDRILEEGPAHGLKLCGMHAMDSLRIEKAYRHWGHDIGEEDTPIEAGLAFVVAFDKKVSFIGREALLKQKSQKKLTKRLVQFALEDPEPLLYHNEPIYRDGKLVGYTSSANYGHTLGRAIALGYVNASEGVDQAYLDAGKFELEVSCRSYPARVSLRPLYDPRSERMRT